jgi:NADH-quinone oxidoreductase subunit J
MPHVLFYFFAFFTVITAVGVIVNKNAVNAALCLLLSLVGVAGLFALLDAYLLAALLVLVYAGAVVALFLFIVMLLDVKGGTRLPFKPMTAIASSIGLALLLTGLATLVNRTQFAAVAVPTAVGQAPVGAVLKRYAEMLFTTYLLPVQVVGFLLLISMLGVIVLSRKHPAAEETP